MEMKPERSSHDMVVDHSDVEENRVFALLAYIGILFLVPLLAARHSPFARFHTNQGVILFLGWLIWAFINLIPVIGWILGIILVLILLVLSVMGVIYALMGKMKKLPLIGNWVIVK